MALSLTIINTCVNCYPVRQLVPSFVILAVPAPPPGDTDGSIITYVIAGVSAVLALVLIVIVCVIAYICVSLCRAEKEQDTFGGFTRRSSFRMSLKKPKLVDPLEQFRATHPWPSETMHTSGYMTGTDCPARPLPCRPGEPPPCATEWVPVQNDSAAG